VDDLPATSQHGRLGVPRVHGNVATSVYVKVGRARVAPTKDLIADVSGKMSTIELAGNGHALLTLPRSRGGGRH
jgi:hypothetical protein